MERLVISRHGKTWIVLVTKMKDENNVNYIII